MWETSSFDTLKVLPGEQAQRGAETKVLRMGEEWKTMGGIEKLDLIYVLYHWNSKQPVLKGGNGDFQALLM